MRLAILFLLPALLLAGCLGDGTQNAPDTGNAQNDGSQNSPSSDGPGYSASPTSEAGSDEDNPVRGAWLIAVRDMAVFNGKLYILGSYSSGAAAVYEYVDDKTMPKKILTLGYGEENTFSQQDPRFKNKLLELNSLAVHENKLYAAGIAGLFRMKENGGWEYLNYPVSGGVGDVAILRLKAFDDGLYAGAAYYFSTAGSENAIQTRRVLKFTGSGWQELPGASGTGIGLGIHDLEKVGGTLYVAAESYAVYRYVTQGEGAPYFEDLTSDVQGAENYVKLERFIRLGTDGTSLYACGEGAKVYKYSEPTWVLLKEVADDCKFFKQADGVLYFGVGGPWENPALDNMGLFKIGASGVEQVAAPLNEKQASSLAVHAVAKYNGQLIAGTVWSDRGGALYKVENGKLDRIVFNN